LIQLRSFVSSDNGLLSKILGISDNLFFNRERIIALTMIDRVGFSLKIDVFSFNLYESRMRRRYNKGYFSMNLFFIIG